MTSPTDQRPPGVDWLERRIKKLEQEVQELRAARGLPASSFRGGSFTFFDNAGLNRHVLGNVDLDGSIAGIRSAYGNFVYGDGGTPNPDSLGGIILAFRSGDRGWTYPDLPFPLHPPTSIAVTSATFAGLLEGMIAYPAHEVIYVEGAVITDAATTGELRLREAYSGVTTDVLPIPANTNGRYSFSWLHPAPTGLYDPRPRSAVNMQLALDARRIAGASMVVYPPLNCVMTSQMLRSNRATAAGDPQLS